MWTIIIRAAALIGIGFGIGTMASPQVVEVVPAPVYQEIGSSISPFLVISVGILLFAGGYFVWAWRRER